MPSFGTVKVGGPSADIVAQQAVLIDQRSGAPFEFARIIKITHSGDVMVPSKALVAFNTLEFDTAQLITFTGMKNQGWTRCSIEIGGTTVFIGNLARRIDTIESTEVMYEFDDDRAFLNHIPVHGCLVYDIEDSKVKFIPRLDPHVSPNSYRNCTLVDGSGGIVMADGSTPSGRQYAFAAIAEQSTYGASDDTAVGDENSTPGDAIDWNPGRWINYLCLYSQADLNMNADSSVFNGTFANLDTAKVSWTARSWINILTTGSGVKFVNPIIRKMPDRNFLGKTVAVCLKEAMEIAGNLGFSCLYGDDGITTFDFYPTSNIGQVGEKLPLQRSGVASDPRTMYGGLIETDYRRISTGVAIIGAPNLVEVSMEYNGTASTSTLQLPWTAEEERNFMRIIIEGKDPDGVVILRSDGTTPIDARSIEAMLIARQAYPKVFRALRIADSGGTLLKNALGGADGSLANFPQLKSIRLILDEQLQPFFEVDAGKRGRMRLPIRVQTSVDGVSNIGSTNTYQEGTFNNGLRPDADGLIFFDGMTDEQSGAGPSYSLVTSALTDATVLDTSDVKYPKMRKIRINVALVHDARVFAAKDVYNSANGDPNELRKDIDHTIQSTTLGPRLLHLVQSDGYRVEHQYKSRPAPDNMIKVATKGGSGYTFSNLNVPAIGITKVLYTDANQLDSHADRLLSNQARPQKIWSCKFPGLQLGWYPGMWIESIMLIDGNNRDNVFVGASAGIIELDIVNQTTTVKSQTPQKNV